MLVRYEMASYHLEASHVHLMYRRENKITFIECKPVIHMALYTITQCADFCALYRLSARPDRSQDSTRHSSLARRCLALCTRRVYNYT